MSIWKKKKMAEHFIKVYFRGFILQYKPASEILFFFFLFERRGEVCLGNKGERIVSRHVSPIHTQQRSWLTLPGA